MLEKIADFHFLWIDFVGRYCKDYHYTQDIVQEMYIKCSKIEDKSKLEKDGEVNKSYIFAMLRNLCTDYYRASTRVEKTGLKEIEEVYFDDEPSYTLTHHEIHEKIRQKLRDVDPYYELMYMTYTSAEDPSMRDISYCTTISLTTIFNDIKKIKKIIKDEG